MSKLIDPRTLIKVNLPSFPEDTVILYDGLLTSEFREILKCEDDYDRGILTLQFMIKEWTFVDEKEKALEISAENLGKLPSKDFTALIDTSNKSLDTANEKKKRN